MISRLTRIPPKGRRALILRSALDGEASMSALVQAVGLSSVGHPDPSIDRLKTMGAVRDLRRRGLLSKTNRGWRTTAAGLELLRASGGHHA